MASSIRSPGPLEGCRRGYFDPSKRDICYRIETFGCVLLLGRIAPRVGGTLALSIHHRLPRAALPRRSCQLQHGCTRREKQRDPAVFPEPEVFRPERFLERTCSPFEFLPFGGGHRRCIGAAFALCEMKLILGTLLRRYSFELVSKKPVRVGLQGLPGSPVRVIVR
ncbi:cytochrome P450 [Sorangium sp. So ce1151]|uniref:cytochrome P450 n=1 Tax=Sorangium sp. So ce1151 TaxID=3133332 RepID=UPI003F60A4FE